jgi:16S rRNA processing protein RimM
VQVVIGRIGRAHGIGGLVSVEVRTDDPERRFPPGAVLVTDPASAGPLTITAGRVHSGRLLLRFQGVHDRTAAERLRGTLLLAETDPRERPEDPEEFYDHQLEGMDVLTIGGELLGVVAEMLHLPGQDLVVVHLPGGGEALVPFVAALVPEVDLARRRMLVDPPPGLFGEG